MVTTAELKELNGSHQYNFSAIWNMVGLNAVREAIFDETDLQPVDGCVVLGKKEGLPSAVIAYSEDVPQEVLDRAESRGTRFTSREAELNLR